MIKKNMFPILVLIIALAIISYFIFGNKSLDGVRQDLQPGETTLSEDTNPDNLGEVTKVCYLKTTTSATDPSMEDREYIEINYAENAVVTGFMSFVSTYKDSSSGTFVGAQNGEFVNVIYSGEGEGTTWDEQVIFKITDAGITRSNYVEKVADEEGTLMFADISVLEFVDDAMIAPVACDTVDVQAVGL